MKSNLVYFFLEFIARNFPNLKRESYKECVMVHKSYVKLWRVWNACLLKTKTKKHYILANLIGYRHFT